MIRFKPHPASTAVCLTHYCKGNVVWRWACECTVVEHAAGLNLFPCGSVTPNCIRDAETPMPERDTPTVYLCPKCGWRGPGWKIATITYPEQENFQDEDDDRTFDVCPACRANVAPLAQFDARRGWS